MQNINLYTDAFKPAKVKLPLEQIIIFPVLLVFVLVGVTFLMSSYLQTKEDKLAELLAKNKEMTDRLTVLKAKAEKLRPDDALIASNKRLQQTLEARKSMLSTLDKVVLEESAGFSSAMIALARQHQQGLWLTRIQLGGDTRQLSLQGVTTKAELVPVYLQNLRQEPSFKGRHFTMFELRENETQSGWLNFTLMTEEQNKQAVQLQSVASMANAPRQTSVLNSTADSK